MRQTYPTRLDACDASGGMPCVWTHLLDTTDASLDASLVSETYPLEPEHLSQTQAMRLDMSLGHVSGTHLLCLDETRL